MQQSIRLANKRIFVPSNWAAYWTVAEAVAARAAGIILPSTSTVAPAC